MRALVTTVVAWTTTPSIACAATPALAGQVDTAEKAFQQVVVGGQGLVDGRTAEPRSTASVKVPPISTASE